MQNHLLLLQIPTLSQPSKFKSAKLAVAIEHIFLKIMQMLHQATMLSVLLGLMTYDYGSLWRRNENTLPSLLKH